MHYITLENKHRSETLKFEEVCLFFLHFRLHASVCVFLHVGIIATLCTRLAAESHRASILIQ